jgi:putative FmdB family regulatory protein
MQGIRMPIYEYRCSECGFQDEFLQKLSDPLMTVCPSCGKESLKKLLSAAGFQLKGSGWYATDFKGSGSKPAVGSDSKSDTKSAGSDTAAKPSGDSASSGSSTAATPKTAPAGTSG